MDRKQQVYAALKPKCNKFGFTQEELKSIAELIDGNLKLADDASEEEVTNAITTAVDATVPILAKGQVMASRVIDAYVKNHPDHKKDDDADPDKDKDKDSDKDKDDVNAATLKLIKELTDKVGGLTTELTALKSGKIKESRKEKLEKVLKDTGLYGTSILKGFDRMKFDTDEDFEEYMTDVETQVQDYKKEQKDKGLASMTKRPGETPHFQGKEISDADIDRLVEGIN